MKYRIVNLVAYSNLKYTLDLYELATAIPNIEYEPEQFPGAVLKIKEPKVSMLLFKNGKTIVSGARNEEQITAGIKKAVKLIRKVHPKIKIKRKIEYTIVNMVASASLNKQIDLFELALGLDNVEYETEQFPGAVMKLTEPKASILVFLNGQIICAGIKNEKDLKKALNKTKKLVAEALNKSKQETKISQTKKRNSKPKTIAAESNQGKL